MPAPPDPHPPLDPAASLPEVSSDLAERLRRSHGVHADPELTLVESSEGSPPSTGSLSPSSKPGARYALEGEIARGGMGAVLGIYDHELRRKLAMKVILPRADGLVDAVTLSRFLEEAQVTAQLDHPGVVPVHELGLDDKGQVYFTMKRVQGQDLRAVYEKARSGEDGWNRTRVLNVLLRACEAMAFAHSKGVLHRDLKPANLMVGRFGEVYVMDWGLARVLGREDRQDLRLRAAASASLVQSDRREQAGTPDSPLLTMEGRVVGTPAYMPVEQAEGRREDIGPEADVYSMGAMLYELLAGQMPYVRPGAHPSPHTVLAAVMAGPPEPLGRLAPDAPAELVAICEKAMARAKEDRYGGMGQLGADLRAFLEHRVVQAYRTGPVVELRNWVRRNRGLAAALAVGLLLLLGLGGTAVVAAATREKNVQLAAAVDERDRANAGLQTSNRALDERNRLLGDLETLRALRQREQELWPARPALLAAMQEWVLEAEGLVSRLPQHERDLAALRASAAEVNARMLAEALARSPRRRQAEDAGRILAADAAGDGAPLPDSERDFLRGVRAEIEDAAREAARWRFPDDPEKQWRHDNLAALVSGTTLLATPDSGLLASVRRRIERARSIEDETVGEHFDEWLEAIEAIARSEEDGGFELEECVGLVPIGTDPESGRWEFWHVESGARPERDPDSGRIEVSADMGLVLVLIPGGTVWMGASPDPASPHHDPGASPDEGPVHAVHLDPFMISKYELTQAQWFRLTGERPSSYAAGDNFGGQPILDTNPVTNVSWDVATRVLPRTGLRLPTEAQWECAARAGSITPWWCGDSASIAGPEGIAANLFDEASLRRNPETRSWGGAEPWDDGHTVHAPVGSGRANALGLHDVLGNVWELCEDEFLEAAYSLPVLPEDGHRVHFGARTPGPVSVVSRGGSFVNLAGVARSAHRDRYSPTAQLDTVGLRPAMTLRPN